MIDPKVTDIKTVKSESSSTKWPVDYQRPSVKWYPAGSRLIGLVRANIGNYVLPPAVVRKAHWRD